VNFATPGAAITDKEADPDLTGRLEAITANTLVLWGRDDHCAVAARRAAGPYDSPI
jgi:hypothetical protein